MAADFVQSHSDLQLDCNPLRTSDTSEENKNYYRGEMVKPGANPGVLISATKVWRNGKEMVTEVEGLFPQGTVEHITPSSSQGSSVSLIGKMWEIGCSVTMLTFGLGAKLVLKGFNTTIVHGKENLDSVWNRGKNTPLLSVTNHHSCFDDPGIWGAILSPSQLADRLSMRWGASASEVIFANWPLAIFFSLGKVVPIVRGWGVEQPAMQFLLRRLDGGGWVNMFPEARVNADDSFIRYRWGVGRLMWDCITTPILLPVVHIGMDKVLPNPRDGERQPVILRPGNLITVNIGKPVHLDKLISKLKLNGVNVIEARKILTAEIQDVMKNLHKETILKHKENILRWVSRWHDEKDLIPSILT